IDATIIEVKKNGHRVKIILSRAHPEFVRRLFFKEIPEINDHTIEMRAIAREAGYRTKVAVSSIDMKVDCVGACVGVRGSRIKNIVDAEGRSLATPKPNPAAEARKVLGDTASPSVREAVPTFEQLFREKAEP